MQNCSVLDAETSPVGSPRVGIFFAVKGFITAFLAYLFFNFCAKWYVFSERVTYYKLEADIEKTLLRTFDDGGGDEKEDEGEVEAGVTGACEVAGDSPPPDVFPATSKKRPRPASSSSPATPSPYRRVKHNRFGTSSPGVSVRTN